MISVIMGVFNSKPEMLKKAVQSVLSQTEQDIELIICDDGSDTATKDLLCNISHADSRIKVITHSENKGLAAALNTCLDNASGEYIARQDDDDYSYPDRLRQEREFLEANPGIDFCGCSCDLFDSDGNIYSKRDMPCEVTAESFLFNSPFIHGSMMFKKQVFNNHRYAAQGKNRKYEDYELFMRLYADGFTGANLSERLYAFYFDKHQRRISYSMRWDEFKVRLSGFKRLGLYPKGIFYAIKPLILGLIPHRLFNRIKQIFGRL